MLVTSSTAAFLVVALSGLAASSASTFSILAADTGYFGGVLVFL
jgi:hypothetical protein